MKINRTGSRAALLTGAMLVMALPAIASAQEAAPGQEVPESEGIQDIVVTAQKRTESAQRVPSAVIAIDGSELASRGIADARQLSALVPSARFEPVRSQVQVTVRGIGQSNTGPNADPAVATNLNGVYQLNDMTGAAFFDIDRVEVLSGPQGTLYGRNAAGGAVNVFTRRPGSKFGGNASVEVGNYGTVNVEGGVDVPMGDAVAVRASGMYQRHDGYLSNGANDRDAYAGRLTAVIEPTDRFSLVVVGSYSHFGGIGDQVVNKPGYDPNDAYFYPFTSAGRFTRDNVYTVSAEANFELNDNLTLTYVGGYDHFTRRQFLDLNARLSPLAVQTQNIRQEGTFWSHEGRLSGDYDAFNFVLGAFYYDADQFYSNVVVIPGGPTVRQTPINVFSHGVGLFGQLTYSLSDTFRLTGGLRYSNDHKNGSGDFTVILPNGTVIPSPFAGVIDSERLDWKGGLELDVAPDSLAYATVQTGFNQGGFSFAPASVGGGNIFKPMELVAYTAGIKNRFADRTVQVNLEGFYYDYKNYQVSARDLATGLNVIYNAQKARVYGLQLDTMFHVTPSDRLNFSLGLVSAKLTELVLPAGVGGRRDFSGNALPNAPEITATGSYEHDFIFANGGKLTPRAAVYYVSSRYAAYSAFAGSKLDEFAKVDLQLTYTPDSERWTIGAYVRNLFDIATYGSVVAASLPGPAAGFLEPPRTFGVRLTGKF